MNVRWNDDDAGLLGRLFRRGGEPRLRRNGKSDVAIAVAGIALGLTCALFPWYVFFNQDDFGVRAMRFEGQRANDRMPNDLAFQPHLIGRPVQPDEVPRMELDMFATGTLPDNRNPSTGSIPLEDQPFPGEDRPAAQFRVVHITKGRAMIEDDSGLWLVEPGALLPDNGRVTSIEQRGDRWFIVTADNRALPVSE